MEASFLAREIAKEMFNRLDWMKLNPQQVIDLGCGVGIDALALAQRYPEAQVGGIDLRETFLQYGKRKQENRVAWVVADCHTLPLGSNAVDLIFANLLLPWIKNTAFLLREWRRILRPQGLVFFSCLGPDTFQEWRTSKKAVLPHLMDMHNVGDALLEAGFIDPVLEVENLILNYRSPEQGQWELKKSELWQEEEVRETPTTTQQAVFPVTFEVVYGHAWCPATKGFKADDHGVVRIPVSQLGAIDNSTSPAKNR